MKLFSRKPKELDNSVGVQRLQRIKDSEMPDEMSERADQSLLIKKTPSARPQTGLTGSMILRERSVHRIHFKTLASDKPGTSVIKDRDIENSQLVLRTVFAPSTPILDIDYFAGRIKEITRAVSAIENERMHLIIHGKRGLGKTSFSNALCNIAKEANYIVCKTSCSQYSTFSEIFRSFLKEIPLLYDKNFITNHGVDTRQKCFDTLLPEGAFSPKDLTKILLRLTSARVLFVLDEFDRNQTPNFKDSILETIKNFSDNCVRANLILIGATDTVDELIGLNESVRRNISGIPIKVFNEAEVAELFDIGDEHGINLKIATAVEEVNIAQKQILCKKITAKFGSDLHGLTFAVWGLAFKPGTDDVREAPSLVIIPWLLQQGARVQAYDPVASHEAQKNLPCSSNLVYLEDSTSVLKDADALLILTEWKEFRMPNFETLKAELKSKSIFDGRNIYNPLSVKEEGIEYYGIGCNSDE